MLFREIIAETVVKMLCYRLLKQVVVWALKC